MSQIIFLFVSSFSLLIGNVVGLKTESIIGGVLADENQFPYMVSLQLDNISICGGALIAPDLVLTAVHCVMENDSVLRLPFTVLGGVTDLKNIKKGQRINVAKIYAPNTLTRLFNHSSINDIAVLRLSEKFNVEENASIGLINLPEDNDDTFFGKTAVISGFGWNTIFKRYNALRKTVERIGRSENKLKFATIEILNNLECNDYISSHICGRISYTRDYKRGVCHGDSGGPLVHQNKVIGIVSYGISMCDEYLRPTIYTRVSSFLNFIEGAMKDEPTHNTTVVTIF